MRYRETKSEKKKGKMPTKGGNLAPEKEIVEKNPGNFPSRYSDLLAPKDKVVEPAIKPTYNSRYE